MTNAERQAKHKAKLLAEGGAKVVVNVPGAINARLQSAADAAGLGIGAFILSLLDGALPAAPVEPVKAKAVDKGEVYGPTWQDIPVKVEKALTWNQLQKRFTANDPHAVWLGYSRAVGLGFEGLRDGKFRDAVRALYAEETRRLVVCRIVDASGHGSSLERAFREFLTIQGPDMLIGPDSVDFTLDRLNRWIRLDEVQDEAPAIRDLFA